MLKGKLLYANDISQYHYFGFIKQLQVQDKTTMYNLFKVRFL